MSETGKSVAVFECPKCGHDTARFVVMRSATYCANDVFLQSIGETITECADDTPANLRVIHCNACETQVDVPADVKAAIIAHYQKQTGLPADFRNCLDCGYNRFTFSENETYLITFPDEGAGKIETAGESGIDKQAGLRCAKCDRECGQDSGAWEAVEAAEYSS